MTTMDGEEEGKKARRGEKEGRGKRQRGKGKGEGKTGTGRHTENAGAKGGRAGTEHYILGK